MVSLVAAAVGLAVITILAVSTDDNETLFIGVILDKRDNISGSVISLALQYANAHLKPFYKLEAVTDWLEENHSFYAIRKACNLLNRGLVAFLSPIAEVPSRHISALCSKFHIPHLVTSCRFPESLENYPMDITVSPNCDQYAKIIFHFITQVESWRDMILIHSSDNCILKFEHLLNQFESRFKMRQWVHHDLQRNKQLMREISKKKKYLYFLVDIPYWQIKDFLIMASVHNMTDPQYSFIFADWDSSLVDIAAFKINNNFNITTFSIINSTMVKSNRKSHAAFNNFLKEIGKNVKDYKKTDIEDHLMSQPAIILDAVSLLAKAILNLKSIRPVKARPLRCLSNDSWELGSSLINAITSVEHFDGYTGSIAFNEKAQRTAYNLSVMDLTENGFEEKGLWAEQRNEILITPKEIESSIVEMEKIKQPLKVTTIENMPFVYYKDGKANPDNYDTSMESWDGFCIELLREIGLDLGLNFTIHLVKDGKFGTVVPNETYPDGSEKWNGMIGELITKEADLVVGPMTISYEREKVVDFTTPFMSLGLSILFLQPQKEPPGLFSFLSPLSPPVWGYVIGAYIGVSFIIFLIAHITPYEWVQVHPCENDSDRHNQFHLLQSLWFAVGALVRQGLEFCPQASSTRMVSGAWWFFTLIIISTYTANLVAFLTIDLTILPIKSVDDLANQTNIKYGTLKGGASEAFFQMSKLDVYNRMAHYMSTNPDVLVMTTEEGVKKVQESKGKYAFLLESAMNDFYVQRDCRLIRVGDLLDSKGYGVGFPAGSPLRDQMTVTILKLQKSQKIANLYHRYWYEFNITEPCADEKKSSGPSSIEVNQVVGVFFLLGVGLVFAGFVAIIELYVEYKKKKYQWKMPFRKFFKKELQFAMRFMSSSKKSTKPMNHDIKHVNHQINNPNDVSIVFSHLLPQSPGKSDVSAINHRQIFTDIDSPCLERNDFLGSSHDTLASGSNSKCIWSLHNDF